MEYKRLSNKEILFAEALLRGMSNIESAKEAGYSVNYTSWARSNLKKPHIKKYLEDRRQEIIEQSKVDEQFITSGFKSIFNRCMQQVPVMEYDRELKMMVHKTDEEGNGVYTFDSNGAVRAMENLAKHIGYYEIDNNQKRPVINVAIVTNNNYEDQAATDTSEYSDRSISAMLPPLAEE